MSKPENPESKSCRCCKFLKKHALTLTILCLVAIIYGVFGKTRHAGPASGTELNFPQNYKVPSTISDTIKIATFNIHSAKGTDGVTDLNRTGALLKDLDIVALNEVSRQGFMHNVNQAELLGNMLNMPWLFAPTETRWCRDDFGSAVLCALPVTSWHRFPVKTLPNKGKRNFLLMKVNHPKGPINVLITHISNYKEDPTHIRSTIDLFLSLEKPAILIGDMNNISNCPAIIDLLKLPDVKNAIDRSNGDEYLDWIFVRGLDIIDSKVEPKMASDHATLYAELAWPENE